MIVDTEDVIAMILAGGKGQRLYPLTKNRAKSAVPIGGVYRLIDFPIYNLRHSGIEKIYVLLQTNADLLSEHIALHHNMSISDSDLGRFISPLHPKNREYGDWYAGTAAAIHKNIEIMGKNSCEYVVILGGDHLYKIDVRQMLEFHIQSQADITISSIPVAREKANEFGVLQIKSDGRVEEFREKPRNPPGMPEDPSKALCSMGNYVFGRKFLEELLEDDSKDERSSHDFGKDIIPNALDQGRNVFAYDFSKNVHPGMNERERGYWRDVGTIGSYFDANMDLIEAHPVFNLYNRKWKMRMPPSKFVHGSSEIDNSKRIGAATDSLISPGCIISGSHISRVVLSPDVHIHSYSEISDAIIFEGVEVGQNCKIKRTIIDENNTIPGETKIGYNLDDDRRMGLHVDTDNKIVVIPAGFFK